MFDPPRLAPEFSLRGSDGSRGDAGALPRQGRADGVRLSPVARRSARSTLATLAQARSSLGEAADAVQVIYVTVDPERDDAARMKDYLAAFDPSFVGAHRHARTRWRRCARITASRPIKHGTGDDYVMDHSSSIYLIDRSGRLRALMPYGHDADDFVHDIKLLLVQ